MLPGQSDVSRGRRGCAVSTPGNADMQNKPGSVKFFNRNQKYSSNSNVSNPDDDLDLHKWMSQRGLINSVKVNRSDRARIADRVSSRLVVRQID